MRKKAILIYAFLSNNLGDDIFVKMLCERYPKHSFIISAEGIANKTLRSIPNLHFSAAVFFLNKLLGLERVFREHRINTSIFSNISRIILRHYETAVYIAGSIFVQKADKFLGNDTTLRNRHLTHKDFFIIGANFGPFRDPRYRDVVENQFSHVTDICFRDSASKMFFDKMSNVRWAPDVVFGLKQPMEMPQKKIVISVIKCNRKGRPAALAAQTEVYEIVLTEVCAILSRLGYSICLMSFCEPQGDGETATNIKNRCLDSKIQNVSEYHYSGNVDEALKIIAESERVIATRFHMMILGWVMNKPVYPLIYDQKMKCVLEDTGFFKGKEIIKLKRDDAEEIAYCLLKLFPANCDNQRIESVKQFEGLDKFIMEKNYVDGF